MGYKTTAEAWKLWTPKEVKKFRVAVYQLADGSFDSFVLNANKIPEGARRLDPQPPYPHDEDPREGTKVALKKLEAKHPRELAWAAHVAIKIAKRKLTVHSREVRDELHRLGVVGESTGAEFWLGAAMARLAKEGLLTRTGSTYKYTDSSRGIHERSVTIWQLKDGADTSAYACAPEDKG